MIKPDWRRTAVHPTRPGRGNAATPEIDFVFELKQYQSAAIKLATRTVAAQSSVIDRLERSTTTPQNALPIAMPPWAAVGSDRIVFPGRPTPCESPIDYRHAAFCPMIFNAKRDEANPKTDKPWTFYDVDSRQLIEAAQLEEAQQHEIERFQYDLMNRE